VCVRCERDYERRTASIDGWRSGDQLHPDDQREVLALYDDRYTGEHRPQWVADKVRMAELFTKLYDDPLRTYPVQFVDDADWLANTLFKVRKDGRLSRNIRHCRSTPTWPDPDPRAAPPPPCCDEAGGTW
jgi:hypothetical protein